MVLHDRVMFWEQNSGVPSGLKVARTESQKKLRRITDLNMECCGAVKKTRKLYATRTWKKLGVFVNG